MVREKVHFSMRVAVLLALVGASVAQPSSWLPAIAQQDLLYAPTDAGVPLMPIVGNGFLATIINSTNLYLAGVFNGYLTSAPSHRARLQTPLNIVVNLSGSGAQIAAGLSLRNATYLRQIEIPSVPGCSASSGFSCTYVVDDHGCCEGFSRRSI